ncbi:MULTISPECIES: FAD-dependent monooxygenase [unclassified Arthrobacter]|uniref:FAD-dependent monooxygenase n=1 Tax=unclassified Arthrobacter TaxID=235627 RepID=UPI0028833EE3|nr:MULTISPECIES: FAD-dependent monooxygenase [unclassified Arthrobacter]
MTLLEKEGPHLRTGGALMIEDALIERVTGWDTSDEALRIPASLPGGGQAWETVHRSLRATVERDNRISAIDNTLVVGIDQNTNQAWVTSDAGEVFTGDFVVGADGHRSVVRRAIAPDHQDAGFAQYVIWLGMVDEASLPAKLRGNPEFDGGAFLSNENSVLFGYAMRGRRGGGTHGHRRIGWALYDNSHNAFLRDNGHVRNDVVHHSVRPDDISAELYVELAEMVQSQWPSPWRELIAFCITRQEITGTPIAEYLPTTLVNGRLAIIGDAAHVHTPMTGQGFGSALTDAEALAQALTGMTTLPDTLRAYEDLRLRKVQGLVRSGQDFSRRFARTQK